ncbi:MAG: XkdF-like putative serine protease domain-containing protein [Janthinobacterium lividum]
MALAAVALDVSRGVHKGSDFDESKHPRAENGQFGEGSSSGAESHGSGQPNTKDAMGAVQAATGLRDFTAVGTTEQRAQLAEKFNSAATQLSDALGVPSQFIGLNGRLAVHVEGKSLQEGALAQYHNASQTITMGDGVGGQRAFSHEFAHALDYHLATQIFGQQAEGVPASFIHQKQAISTYHGQGHTPQEKLYRTFSDVLESPEYQKHIKNSAEFAKKHPEHEKYINDPEEVFARAFSSYADSKLEGKGKKQSGMYRDSRGKHAHPDNESALKLGKHFDKLISALHSTGYISKRVGKARSIDAALALFAVQKAGWNESVHPRDVNEKFGSGSGGLTSKQSSWKQIFKAEEGVAMADSPTRDAQRLVSGMDFELRGGAPTVADAWTRASSAMRRQWTRYDNSFTQEPEVARLDGLDLDLGCGNARARGYLGLDLYPYDFGTVIRDLGMGLGFGPGTARAIRLVNTLESLEDYRDNPLPLLAQIQATLQEGGRLYYEGRGDLTGMCDFKRLPGLVLIGHEDSSRVVDPDQPAPARGLSKQTFERVPVLQPMFHGADPSQLGVNQADSADLGMAMAALTASPSPETAMANLIHKAVTHTVVKGLALQPHRQLVTSVVYSPDELDTDGEYMTAEDIEAAAHDYMRDARQIGSEHGAKAIGAHVVESWITPCDLTLDGQNGQQQVSAGSWLMTVKIDDVAEWNKLLSGQYTGFSLGGTASLHDG